MNKEEMLMVNTYKCEELKKRLKPITNWDKVTTRTMIFHKNDNNIYNNNQFLVYNKEENLIRYLVIDYSKPENKEYTMSAKGWYYYDESIAYEIEEMYTPKLYNIWNKGYPEEYQFVVAFNEKHLKQDYIKEYDLAEMTDKEFWDEYVYVEIKEIDGFEIVLK